MVMAREIVRVTQMDQIMTIVMKEKEVVRITGIEEINVLEMKEKDIEESVTGEMTMMTSGVTEGETETEEEEEVDINTLVQIQWTQVNLVPQTTTNMVGGIEMKGEVAIDTEEVLTMVVLPKALPVRMNKRLLSDVKLLCNLS